MHHLTDPSVLVSTLHDPTGVFTDVIPQSVELIRRHFSGWSVNVTAVTADPVVAALHRSGVNVTKADPDNPFTSSGIENDHLYALKGGLEQADLVGTDAIAYTDGDRAILAALYYQDFLETFAQTSESVTSEPRGHVNVRRAPEDYLTHPYFDTEFEINRLCSKAFGGPVDVVSTTHMMHADTVNHILTNSGNDDPLDFPHLKWFIMAGKSGAKLYSREIRGLPFETPYQVVQGDRGDYAEVLERYNRTMLVDPEYRASVVNPAEHSLRYGTVGNYLTYLHGHLKDFDMTDQRRLDLAAEISQSVKDMEGRRLASTEALGRSLSQTLQDVPIRYRMSPGTRK